MARLETARAKIGATILDVFRPGWAKEIDREVLDLADCEVCVLGQLFGSYEEGVCRVFAVAEDNEKAAICAGFNLPKCGGKWSTLTEAWRREIGRRVR